MKRNLVYIFCLALFICTGCKKDEKESIALKVHLETVDGMQKVYMEGTLPAWDPNDQVRVNGKTCSVEVTGSGTGRFATILGADRAASYRAVYPAGIVNGNSDLSTSATVNVTLPREQTYETVNGQQVVRLPMASLSSTEELYFKNLCSVLKITVSNPSGNVPLELLDIVVKAPGALLSGSGSVTIDGTGQPIQLASGQDSVILKGINTTIAAGNSSVYYVVVPTFSDKEMQFRLVVSEGRYVKKHTLTARTLARNKLVSIGFTADKIEDDDPNLVVGGYFSVSATEKVRFSRGNLWYERSTGTYHFEDNQTVYGAENGDVISGSTEHLSYFNWSKTESVARTLPYSDPNYTTSDHLFTNDPLFANRPNAGFTVEGATGKFRTLTYEEMEYMLFSRTNAGNLWANKTINGSYGLVVLPDDCSVNASSINSLAALEAAKGIFLPASGGVGAAVYSKGSVGVYWLSSTQGTGFCCNLVIYSGTPYNQYGGTTSTMRSIRLVCR